jgi:type IV pilus assembly protein PilM
MVRHSSTWPCSDWREIEEDHMARSVVGIEIAEESVRAVEVTSGRHPQLVAAGEVRLPAGSARDSDVLDTDAVATAVTTLWSQARIKSRKVVVALVNRRILVRDYTAPNLPIEELSKALRYEAQDLIPVAPEDAVLDFYPLEVDGSQAKGLLVAGPADNVESILNTLAKTKLRVDNVDFLPFGLARVAGRVVPEGFGPVAMVAVGEHTTSFVIAIDGIPRYVRVIAVDVASQRSARDDGAELLVGGRRSMPSLVDGPESAAAEVIGRLSETLRFCRGQDDRLDPRELLLTGPLAPELAEPLAEALQIETRTVLPRDVIAVGSNLADADLPSSLMGALGIMLDGGR